MNARIRSPRDFFAGVIFLSFGLCAVLVGRDYPNGTALRMGAGYFQFVLGLLLFVGLALLVGLLGSLFIKLDYEPAPLLLDIVLGPTMENRLRRPMLPSRASPALFITRPLSLALLLVALALLIVVVLPAVKKKREEVLQE